jgi:hypothetical protein
MTEAECIRVNEKMDSNSRDTAKLWTAHRELAVVVHGPDGENGIRSRVANLESWRERHMDQAAKLDTDLKHYFDIERAETCHGIKELDKHISQHIALETAMLKSKESKFKAFMQGWGQLLQFAGIIIVALISAKRCTL